MSLLFKSIIIMGFVALVIIVGSGEKAVSERRPESSASGMKEVTSARLCQNFQLFHSERPFLLSGQSCIYRIPASLVIIKGGFIHKPREVVLNNTSVISSGRIHFVNNYWAGLSTSFPIALNTVNRYNRGYGILTIHDAGTGKPNQT